MATLQTLLAYWDAGEGAYVHEDTDKQDQVQILNDTITTIIDVLQKRMGWTDDTQDGKIRFPQGANADRPTAEDGAAHFNVEDPDNPLFEVYDSVASLWKQFKLPVLTNFAYAPTGWGGKVANVEEALDYLFETSKIVDPTQEKVLDTHTYVQATFNKLTSAVTLEAVLEEIDQTFYDYERDVVAVNAGQKVYASEDSDASRAILNTLLAGLRDDIDEHRSTAVGEGADLLGLDCSGSRFDHIAGGVTTIGGGLEDLDEAIEAIVAKLAQDTGFDDTASDFFTGAEQNVQAALVKVGAVLYSHEETGWITYYDSVVVPGGGGVPVLYVPIVTHTSVDSSVDGAYVMVVDQLNARVVTAPAVAGLTLTLTGVGGSGSWANNLTCTIAVGSNEAYDFTNSIIGTTGNSSIAACYITASCTGLYTTAAGLHFSARVRVFRNIYK
jgi:hypothetical protein